MRLSDETYEEIKRTVTETFLEYDIHCIPISAFEMATKMGMKIIPYSAMSGKQKNAATKISIDGFSVETQEGDWIIFYNDGCSNYGRINQTIMHEIGHYALGHTKEGEEEEAEAKFFAKYALAPPALIHNVCEKVTVDSIMEKFDISHQAAWIASGYYKRWLWYGQRSYTEYEAQMLDLFKIA